MGRARVRPSPVANLTLFLGAMSLFWVAPHSQSNGSFIPAEDILLTCGASGNGKDADGRTWVTDQGSKFAPPAASNSLSESASSQNPSLPSTVPYMTARIFTARATYSVAVSPGRFWLRLYFYPSNYGSHQGSDALFNVEANSYTLLHNFSTLQTANVLNQAYLVREYSINVTSDRLNITFLPNTPSSYAFVNGIEVESMPNLFGGEPPALVGVSGGASFPIGSSFVLQTMYRLNVGGQNIGPSGDSNLSRTWYDDSFYIYGANNGITLSNDSAVQYTDNDPDYTAPQDVYRTFRSMTPDSNLNEKINLTWLLAVDAGFTYLVRLHFCEWIYTLSNQRVFNIYVNNQTAEQSFDVIGSGSTVGTAMYMDYASTLPAQSGDSNFWVSLQPDVSTKPQYYNSLLNGLELFKINDSSGNLAGPNPVAAPQVNYQGPGTNVIPSSSSSSSSSKGKGPVIGGVAGGVAVLALVLAVCCVVRQRRGRSAGDKHPGWLPLPLYGGNSHTIGSKVSTTSGKSGTGSYASSAPSSFCRHFSFAEIQEATRNFDESRILGVGGFGKVYEGEIDGGVKVAVKRGNPLADQGIHEFQTEIEMLSKLRHRHLVSLIGYCEENCEMILVYDYMAKGPLRGHLYGNSNLSPLSWKQRLDICIGAARGLHYLHTGAAQTIIHRDVKTTNILIDENLVAKVSDFGLSKMGPTLDHTHVSTVVKGSFGYLDPEYYRRQQLTEKSDVYSFGVVLFEVLCARPAINPSLPREQVSIAEWALHYQRKGILEQIIDPYLKGKINPESLKKYGEAAEKCLAEQGVERPAMGDVLWNLEFALQLQETAIENKLVDDSTNNFVEISPDYNCSNNLETYAVDGPSTVTSTGGHSLASEDLDDVNPSAVFSQLVNPQGR